MIVKKILFFLCLIKFTYCYSQDLIIPVITPTTITGPITVCPSIPVTYSVAAMPNAVAHWEVTGGLIIGGVDIGNSISVLFNPTMNTYAIKTWYVSTDCSSDPLEIAINTDAATLTITDGNGLLNNTTECGSSIQSYSVNNIEADNYKWEISPNGAGSIQTGQNSTAITILWNQNISPFANIKLTARKCGKNIIKFFKVTVINTPVVTITAPTTVCSDADFTASFALNIGTTFQDITWDFGDGQTTFSNSNNSITHRYNGKVFVDTNYTITATVRLPNGCILKSIGTRTITLLASPNITFTSNWPATQLNMCNIASGDPNLLTLFSFQSGYTYTVQWFKDLLPISAANNGNSLSFNFATAYHLLGAGTYTIVVTNNLGCTNKIDFDVNDSCSTTACTFNCNIDFNLTTFCEGIRANLTQLDCIPLTQEWRLNSSQAIITVNTAASFEAENLYPGKYSMELYLTQNAPCGTAIRSKQKEFIIPYKPFFTTSFTCNNSNYNIVIKDASLFYPTTPIQNFSFTYDNGVNWYPGTVVNGMHQLNVNNLLPGTYQIGIRISSPGYAQCFKYLPLVLPALPVATFTFINNACENTAMQFHADDQSPGLEYLWDFGDISFNLQRDPVKTFEGSGLKDVILRVTNSLGCWAEQLMTVRVLPVDLIGLMEIIPEKACQGASQIIRYTQANTLTNPPPPLAARFAWYKNLEIPPFLPEFFANTTLPELSVTQSGQYFVYVTDVNGCTVYDNEPKTISLIPTPDAPTIFGAATQCEGSNIVLRVPPSNSLVYSWTVNGVVDPSLQNLHEISYQPSGTGVYLFGVTAQTLASEGGCTSPTATFSVTVLAEPVVPVLAFRMVSCAPYLYNVEVTNPQAGINYYWSNGAVGTVTEMTHGGPIQVRAQGLNCSITAQTDLPADLDSFKWAFPFGCYAFCANSPLGYVTNPIYEFDKWFWTKNGNTVTSGTNSNIGNFNQLAFGNSYQLNLQEENCKTTFKSLSISSKVCEPCKFDIGKIEIKSDRIDGACVYRVTIQIINNFGFNVISTLTAPNGEGYFVPSPFTVLNGNHYYNFIFYTNGFITGAFDALLEGSYNNKKCLSTVRLTFRDFCGTQPSNRNNEETTTLFPENDFLIIAPNPTSSTTNLIFNYVNTQTKKTIDVIDLIGRVLVSLPIDSQSGTQTLDCSRLATGTYHIVMKENDVTIRSCKLVKE